MLRQCLVLVVGIAMVAGCGSSDRRGAEVKAMIDSVWEAAGVDEDIIDVFEYDERSLRTRNVCAHLDPDDRWYGQRSSSIPPGYLTQEVAEEAIVGFLTTEGFSVELYRSRHPDSHVRRYSAVRDETVVYGTLNADGATTVHVRAGPCAPHAGLFDPSVYEVDDDARPGG